jgi:hypothetical protein
MIEGGQGANSFDEGASGQRETRRLYVKPLLRDLDVVDTRGKTLFQPTETGTGFNTTGGGRGFYGPS